MQIIAAVEAFDLCEDTDLREAEAGRGDWDATADALRPRIRSSGTRRPVRVPEPVEGRTKG